MSQTKNRKATSTQNRTVRPSSYRKISGNAHSATASTTKPVSGPSKRHSLGAPAQQKPKDESDMPGLPEFCTTCEKQIMTPPGTSILYCSEACRRDDTSYRRPLSMNTSVSSSTYNSSAASYFDLPESDIVEPRSPTILRPASSVFSDFSVSDFTPPPDEEPKPSDIDSSNEAARYLAQFYSHSYSAERSRPRRPRSDRLSSVADGMPSLSHTPSSSVGTVASMDRPLPRRYKSMAGQASSNSVDLVIPSYPGSTTSDSGHSLRESSLQSNASAVTAFKTEAVEGRSYLRRNLSPEHVRETSSSLTQLLSHDSARTEPSYGPRQHVSRTDE